MATALDVGAEPSEEDYYGGGGTLGDSKPWSVPRVSNVTIADFERYAIQGKPVIVVDAVRDWPMRGWTCDKFKVCRSGYE